jgi:hypothetical protein
MLLGNYSVVNKNPGRDFGRGEMRTLWKDSTFRNRFYSESNVAGVSTTASLPNGYRNEYVWLLAPKNGSLSTYYLNVGTGTISSSNLAGGLNAVGSLSGIGTISNAALGLIASAVAALSGSGTISNAALGASLNAVATLAGQGNVSGSLGALAGLTAALIGQGTLTSTVSAKGNVTADISSFTELSPENLARAVWNALAAGFDTAGTMGEKLNDAGSASNPWSDTSTYGVGTKGRLLQDAADNAEVTQGKVDQL